MTAQEYIEQRLKGIKEKRDKPNGQLADLIYAAIMSKKFRKYSVDPATPDIVRSAIALNIQSNEPIKIAIPFGSYKLWRFEESPEPDWAELFAIIYYAYWLKPITDVYEPGVLFDFCGDDAILELINNIPPEDTDRYKKIFRDLIKFIQPYLPENFTYTFSPVGERYASKEEFLADLKNKVEELKQKGEIALTERNLTMTKFNVRPRVGEEIDPQHNRLVHDAYLALGKRRAHHKKPEILLISATPFKTAIPVGTTKTSVVKFQTGVGVLKKVNDSFIEYIYSPSQLEHCAFSWQDIKLPGLDGKNFNKIRIV